MRLFRQLTILILIFGSGSTIGLADGLADGLANDFGAETLTPELITSCFEDSSHQDLISHYQRLHQEIGNLGQISDYRKEKCFLELSPSEATSVLECLASLKSPEGSVDLLEADNAATECIKSRFPNDPKKQSLGLGLATLALVKDVQANSQEVGKRLKQLEGKGFKFNSDGSIDGSNFTDKFLPNLKNDAVSQDNIEKAFGRGSLEQMLALADGSSRRSLLLGNSVVVPEEKGKPRVLDREKYSADMGSAFSVLGDKIKTYLKKSQNETGSYLESAKKIFINTLSLSRNQTKAQKEIAELSNQIIVETNALEKKFGVSANSIRVATQDALQHRNADIEEGLAKAKQITVGTIIAPAAIYASYVFIAPIFASGTAGTAAATATTTATATSVTTATTVGNALVQMTGAGVVIGGVIQGGLAIGPAHAKSKQYGESIFCYLGNEIINGQLNNIGPQSMAMNLVLPGLSGAVGKAVVKETLSQTGKAAAHAIIGDLIAAPLTYQGYNQNNKTQTYLEEEAERLQSVGRKSEAEDLKKQAAVVAFSKKFELVGDVATSGVLGVAGKHLVSSGKSGSAKPSSTAKPITHKLEHASRRKPSAVETQRTRRTATNEQIAHYIPEGQTKAENALGRKISDEQAAAVSEAHWTGYKENGKDGGLAGLDN